MELTLILIMSRMFFLYIKGRSITPYGSFQQCTRTRNINSLYLYCECWNKEELYEDLQTLEQNLKDSMNHPLLNDVCLTLDKDDEYKYLENTFFKLYAYNDYINDIFTTDKYYHFENIFSK